MPVKTITITKEAHSHLKARKVERLSHSYVLLRHIPAKRKLSEILDEIGRDDELAERIEAASIEMRRSKMRKVEV